MDQYKEKYINQLKQVEGLHIQAFPLYNQLPTGVKLQIPVLFRILVGDNSSLVKRKPIHICLVLDRSGSMEGESLKSCKKAIKHLVQQIGKQDIVSFVVYDQSVDTIFTHKKSCDYPNIVRLIDNVRARGFTNISAGLETAAKILNEQIPDESMQYQKLVFLFSDGDANTGITDLNILGKNITHWVERDGIRFCSFGIGEWYNEKWMRSIARGGMGQYFFIDNIENVTALVENGLHGFTQLIGDNVNFKIKGLNGHLLTSLQNDKTHQTLMDGKKLPYLRNLGLYQFLATVEINAIPNESDYEQDILEGILSLDTLPGLEHLSVQGLKVPVKFSNNIAFDNLEKNDQTICYQVINECAQINRVIDSHIAKREQNKAIELKQQIIGKYENVIALDSFGVIGALMQREKQTLDLLKLEGIGSKTKKCQEYSSSYGYNTTNSSEKTEWEKNKNIIVEEDCDMGHCLFH